MKNRFRKYTWLFPLVAAGALGAGFLGGLLGTGGGILIVFLYARLYRGAPAARGKDLFAMTVGTVWLLSLPAALRYRQDNPALLSASLPFLLPAAIGGLIGAWLLDRVDVFILKKVFAALVIYAGITLLLR